MLPSHSHLVGIARTEDIEVWDSPHSGKVLDRLMRGAIFPDTDTVVSEDVYNGKVHQGRESDCRAGVIGEDEEAGSERPEVAEGQAVADGGHGEFTHTEVDIAAVGRIVVEGVAAVNPGFGGWGKVCGTADEPGDCPGELIQDFAAGSTSCHSLLVGSEWRHAVFPMRRKLALLDKPPLLGEFFVVFRVFGESGVPVGLQLASSLKGWFRPGVAGFVWNVEGAVGVAAVELLCGADFVGSEGLAVCFCGSLAGGGTATYDAFDDDEAGALGFGNGGVNGLAKGAIVFNVLHCLDEPAVGLEALDGVVGVGQFGGAFDGDFIAVVEPDKVVEFEVSGKGCGFSGDTFHHATVAK